MRRTTPTWLRMRPTHSQRINHDSERRCAGTLLKGEYALLWLATPIDWYVRTPGKREDPHWQRMANWIKRATNLQMQLIVCGPPGFPWPQMKDTIDGLRLNVERMRLCHFGEKYDTKNPRPSGSYIQVATNLHLPRRIWQCTCKVPMQEHALDWYGQTQHHSE